MAMSRSEIMARIRSKDTGPERAVRRLLRALGHPGYRLHRKDLPGRPDIAFIGKKKAILVHGCFWHGHDCKAGYRPPKTNADFWRDKIARNRQRDAVNLARLEALGWRVLLVRECELADLAAVRSVLADFLAR